jgi:mRNA interferase MazF
MKKLGVIKHLKLAIVVPVTAWSRYWDENPFFVTLESNSKNGLNKKSSVDCFQIRAINHNRFVKKIGTISNEEINAIKKSIALILDIEPEHCE